MRYDYIVLYASQTGNTKKLATEIFSMLPGRDKDLKPIEEFSADQETETYFIGFCVVQSDSKIKRKLR